MSREVPEQDVEKSGAQIKGDKEAAQMLAWVRLEDGSH